MKLLKIFGIVAGIHAFALILIFANPGCSSSTQRRSSPADTVIHTETGPVVSVPYLAQESASADAASTQMNAYGDPAPAAATPIAFNPDAPAVASAGRYSPTRPNTAVAGALQPEPEPEVVPVSTYTVVRGDSLWSIAKQNNISVADLAAANNLRASAMLQIGQKLIVPGRNTGAGALQAAETAAVTAPVAAVPKTNGPAVKHEVKSGETLGAIARKYQVTVGEIATANNIADPAKIRPGQELVIPGWKAPTPKPAATTPATTPAPAPATARTTTPPADTPPVINPDSPIIFIPPSADQPLDEGFIPTVGEAPVIIVEESNTPEEN
ncbi:MAG: LysM peptidoglycan-binding domain-containing protein [Opitutaceae bacterium]|nr:LysM peptidoglycan-binding domain-containing protein [Opitutaceae bacterium]